VECQPFHEKNGMLNLHVKCGKFYNKFFMCHILQRNRMPIAKRKMFYVDLIYALPFVQYNKWNFFCQL